MLGIQLPDIIFSCELGFAINRLRVRRIELCQVAGQPSAEYIIRRKLDDFGIQSPGRCRQVSCAKGIYLKRPDHILLTVIRIRHACTVDDNIRAVYLHGLLYRFHVCNVHIHVRADYFIICIFP